MEEGEGSMKKAAPLSSNLVAIKGSAAPIQDMPTRSAAVAAPPEDEESGLAPLNFKVPSEFRDRVGALADRLIAARALDDPVIKSILMPRRTIGALALSERSAGSHAISIENSL
jgi:hypothetical protein